MGKQKMEKQEFEDVTIPAFFEAAKKDFKIMPKLNKKGEI